MKFLIAGLGSIGQRHLRNLSDILGAEIIAYRVKKRELGEIEERYNLTTFSDLDTALSQNPDAVLVTNPTSLHMPVALASAMSGCHLFIEKPVSHSLEGVDELIDISEKNNLVILVGCNLRFHPSLRLIKRFLDEKRIGKITSARLHVGEYLPSWHPWEDYRRGYSARSALGGGVILTLIHELDYAYWFFGEVEKVFCFAGKLSSLEIDTEDTAEILLMFKNNIIVEVHMDYIHRPPSRSCHIIGEEGVILWDYYKRQVELFSVQDEKWLIFREEESFERNDMYIEEMKHFINSIERKEKPLVSVRDGKRALEIALAAKESAETGKVAYL